MKALIIAVVVTLEVFYVLEEHNLRLAILHKPNDVAENVPAVVLEALSVTGHREWLAGEAACEHCQVIG
jgi:hypothetical protein